MGWRGSGEQRVWWGRGRESGLRPSTCARRLACGALWCLVNLVCNRVTLIHQATANGHQCKGISVPAPSP